MNEITNNIIDCLNILEEGKALNSKYLERVIGLETRDLFLDFMFLLGYPPEHNFKNKEAIEKFVFEHKTLECVIYKKSEDAKEVESFLLKKKDKSKKKYVHRALKERLIIEENENFYNLYSSINPKDNIPSIQFVGKPIDLKIKRLYPVVNVPIYFDINNIKPEDGFTMEDEKGEVFGISFSNEKYIDEESHNKVLRELKRLNFPKSWYKDFFRDLYSNKVKYVKTGNHLVLSTSLKNGTYDAYIKHILPLYSYFILDENKNVIPISNLDLFEILKHLRVCIAHSQNKFNIACDATTKSGPINIRTKLLILKDKAVSIPEEIYEKLCYVNYNSLDSNTRRFTCCYCPKLNYMLDNEDNIHKYLCSCKSITITSSTKTNLNEVYSATGYYLSEFVKIKNATSELEDYLTNNLNNIFEGITVKVEQLKNTNILKSKLLLNEYLKKNKKGYYEDVREYISFIIKELYEFEITKSNIITSNNKTNNISISKYGLLYLLKELTKALNISSFRNKEDSTLPFKLYKDELYLLKCIFLGYINLVDNSFDDDLDRRKSKLSREEKFKLKMKVYAKTNDNLFKNFRIVYPNRKDHNKEQNLDSFEDSDDIITKIRNSIAHFNIDLKYSKNGDIENSELIFKVIDKNENYYYKIKCKDFITFITNPLFMEHKTSADYRINTSSFEELYDTMINKIKDFE